MKGKVGVCHFLKIKIRDRLMIEAPMKNRGWGIFSIESDTHPHSTPACKYLQEMGHSYLKIFNGYIGSILST
jgi:hypothetical protein